MNPQIGYGEDVLARILKDRARFDKPGRGCDNVSVRLDVEWNQFSACYMADARWVDASGERFYYLFSQEKDDA